MPRRNRRPRPRVPAPLLLPDERPPSTQQLAQQLVSRGLCHAAILGPDRPSSDGPDEGRPDATP